MNVPKTKFKSRKKDIQERIKENPEYYGNRNNARCTYNLLLNNYELIKFKSDFERADFDRNLDELKKAINIEGVKLFTEEFAKITFNIVSYLKKSIHC